MKAARFHDYNTPLVIDEIPIPDAGPGQVLVEVVAMANNPADAAIRAGALKELFALELPHTPGVEVSGTVSALGDGVTGVSVGDRVVAFLPMNAPGAAADYVLAPAEMLAAAPATIPLADASALPATGLTAQQALFEHGRLTSGQRVLVNGAGGAVGAYAVQLAVLAGAEVVATVSPASVERVTSYGPSQVIDHTTSKVVDSVEGTVDLIVNLAMTPSEDLIPLLAKAGRFVTATTPVDEQIGDEGTGIRMGVHPDHDGLADLVAKVDAGDLTVWVENRRPLSDINAVEAGEFAGKTIITLK